MYINKVRLGEIDSATPRISELRLRQRRLEHDLLICCCSIRGNQSPLASLHDNITDTDDNSDLVADVDPDTLIRIVRSELKNGEAPGIDNVCNDILTKAISTGFNKLLARAFTISLKLGFIPYVWKVK